MSVIKIKKSLEKNDILIDDITLSKRRSISILINKEGKVLVRAPAFASESQIINFILGKAKWIDEKKDLILKKKDTVLIFSYNNGDSVPYLGVPHELKFNSNLGYAIKKAEQTFLIDDNYLEHSRELIHLWLKRAARIKLKQMLITKSNKIGLSFNESKVTSAQSRWGSCNGRKNISLSYRLIMAPEKIIDYVIIHELCHTVQLNHSKKFWDLVLKFDPDYKNHKKWLNENSYLLNI